MCEYCEKDKRKKRKYIDNNEEIAIRLCREMGDNLEIKYYYYGTVTGRYIPINYCPMCR